MAFEGRSSTTPNKASKTCGYPRLAQLVPPACFNLYLACSRNQCNAMEVCASLASCPPWNVPIFIL